MLNDTTLSMQLQATPFTVLSFRLFSVITSVINWGYYFLIHKSWISTKWLKEPPIIILAFERLVPS